MSSLLGKRTKEAPKDAQIVSHQLLLRGGYMRQVSAGLFSMLPLGLRVVQKIESIVRSEMNRLSCQEVLMPVVLPRELWEESGRYESVGSELLRFKDRNDKDFVLGMTHEEAVVHLARSEVFSYKQLPFSVYQIQTKFRDEPRSRGGLIRVREFTMKDAYSFHEKDECLSQTYDAMHQAYENIFTKVGLKNFISVASDAGMMGGGVSHEFMAVTPVGEDTFAVCQKCDYKANREVARCTHPKFVDQNAELEKVATPQTESIEDVSSLLNVPPTQTAMAFFCLDADDELVMVLARGDLEINEAKLKTQLGMKEILMAEEDDIKKHGMVPGYASCLGTDSSQYKLLVDTSLRGRRDLVVGANKVDFHIKGFDSERDLASMNYEWVDVTSVLDGSACIDCGGDLKLERGVEIGNIFQLGRKYSESMKMTYLDQQGKAQVPIMGCYGIGIGRLMACVIEEFHDDYGPIWPESIAPYQLQINVLDPKKEGVKDAAEKVYRELLDAGVEVLLDDRGEKAGFQFSDADLIGCPHRVVISPKTLKDNEVEYRTRADKNTVRLPVEGLKEALMEKLKA
jgi:prolyl-tRNA synthetase